jgi:holo-[acyl-carrier protein] synthase
LIVGSGIDLIEVARVRQALERPQTGRRFCARIFTAGETRYCEARGRARYQSYAARFAAKEATMKALGTGWSAGVGWRDIEVVRERGRPPTIKLWGMAAALAARRGINAFHLSISHSAEQAVVAVIAEG